MAEASSTSGLGAQHAVRTSGPQHAAHTGPRPASITSTTIASAAITRCGEDTGMASSLACATQQVNVARGRVTEPVTCRAASRGPPAFPRRFHRRPEDPAVVVQRVVHGSGLRSDTFEVATGRGGHGLPIDHDHGSALAEVREHRASDRDGPLCRPHEREVVARLGDAPSEVTCWSGASGPDRSPRRDSRRPPRRGRSGWWRSARRRSPPPPPRDRSIV
jgi:hypothetical protein